MTESAPTIPVTTPPATAHRKIADIFRYWQRIAPAPDRLPGRQHFDPVDVPKLLENVWLLDVVGTPPAFRFRLIGSATVRAGIPNRIGSDVLAFVPEAARARAYADFAFVVEARSPLWFRGPAMLPHHKEIFELERLYLPLAGDGARVDMLLNLTVFYTSTGAES